MDSTQIASDLGEQNDAFSRALAAKRRGAGREAIDAFDAFVARFPSSPLVESALAQRMQLLRTIDSARARTAAEQYLARYPRGFAASEAASIRRASP
jgi:TolA-binding protein